MALLIYDKTFDGFLSLIFDTFKNKIVPDAIEADGFHEPMLWVEKLVIRTDPDKASRVWKALKLKLSPIAYNAVYRIHLSGINEAEMVLFRFLQKVFASAVNIEENYVDKDVLRIKQLDKQICKEAERMNQFVRFQKTADDIFYASVEPQFNVIPLIVNHFETRFADQQWVIYDSKRRYGFYYNCSQTVLIELTTENVNPHNGKVKDDILATDELHFQQMWKHYFKSTCIEERRNEKLQMQHMPKRYWKYLTEKQD